MGERLQRDHRLERQGPERELVEGAVLPVGLEQPVERQQAGEQRPEPEGAGGDAGEARRVRADAERHHERDDQVEADAEPEAAAGAEREPELAGEHGAGGAHAQAPAARNGSAAAPAAAGSSRSSSVAAASAPWVATMATPPAAAWALRSASSRASPSASRAAEGSSSSQSRRGASARRESASRRRWPAESSAAGRSAIAREPEGGEPGRRVAAGERRPEAQVLGDAELRPHRVEVAGVGHRLGAQVGVERPAVERDPAGRRDEAGDRAQQRRLAGAVRPAQRQHRAVVERQRESVEHAAAAAGAGEVGDGEAHGPP